MDKEELSELLSEIIDLCNDPLSDYYLPNSILDRIELFLIENNQKMEEEQNKVE